MSFFPLTRVVRNVRGHVLLTPQMRQCSILLNKSLARIAKDKNVLGNDFRYKLYT